MGKLSADEGALRVTTGPCGALVAESDSVVLVWSIHGEGVVLLSLPYFTSTRQLAMLVRRSLLNLEAFWCSLQDGEGW